MNEKTKENATIAGATTAGAAIGAGAVLGVNAAIATPKPTSQADDKKAELQAQDSKAENSGEAGNPDDTSARDYANEAGIAPENTGIHTSQNVNIHVTHREVITPTEEQVTPEVEIVEYKVQVNADGSTTDVAVLSVDGHNAIAVDATGDHMADVIALDINGDGIYQQDEIFDVNGTNMDMGELAQQHMLNGGTVEVTLDPTMVAQNQDIMPGQPLMAENNADFNTDYNNEANVDDFVI